MTRRRQCGDYARVITSLKCARYVSLETAAGKLGVKDQRMYSEEYGVVVFMSSGSMPFPLPGKISGSQQYSNVSVFLFICSSSRL